MTPSRLPSALPAFSIWPNLKTIGLVTLVTVLIWVWAEAETQKDDLLHADGTGIAGSGNTARPPATASDEAEITVATLPVMLVVSAGSGKLQWERIHPQQTDLQGVTLTGPRSVIDRIRRGDPTLKLSALLVIDQQDLDSAAISKSVEIAPGGLGLRFAGPAPTVRATISR